MNPEVKALWLADLRSNPPQGQSLLYDGDSYCCLGRLCEVAVTAGVIAPMRTERNPATGVESHYYGGGSPGSAGHSSVVLPQAVVDWAGLDDRDPQIAPEMTATQANDDHGLTFDEIADAIEEYL